MFARFAGYCMALGLVLACAVGAKAGEYDTLTIFKDYKEVALGKYIRYLQDSTNAMSLQDFLEQTSPTRAAMRANQKHVIALGYGQNQYWLSAYLDNTTELRARKYLVLSDPNLDEVFIYLRKRVDGKDSIVQIAQVGDNFYNGQKLFNHRNYVFPLDLPPNTTMELIMQVKRQWEPINFPVFLSSEYNFVRRTNNDNLFLGLYIGIHFTFVLLILTLFFFTKIPFYLLYFALNIFTLLNIISDTGLGLQYIWPTLPFIQKFLPYFITFGTLLVHIYFVRSFFSTALHFWRFNVFLLIVMGLIFTTLVALITFVLIFPTSNLPPQISYVIINSLYLGYGIIIVTLCLAAYYEMRRVEILWVMLAASLQFASWIITIVLRGNAYPGLFKYFSIYELNLFPGHLSTPHISIMLIVLEIFAVSTILSLNYYSVIKENTFSKLRMLVLQRKTINAYIEGQEKERIRLADNIKEGIREDIEMLTEQISHLKAQMLQESVQQKLQHIENDMHRVVSDLDHITQNFIPEEFERKSLNDTVKRIFLPLKTSGLEVQLDLPVLPPNISAFSKVNIARILQEIANNILKHSKATVIKIRIRYNQKIEILIEDNGKGLPDQEKINAGIGLINIQSRVQAMNGIVNFSIPENGGTRTFIQIPMSEIS
jgi:signal transduction histidine kinase